LSSPSTRVAYAVGTFLGAGRSKLAPGTVGSLATIPLHLLLRRLHPGIHLATVLVGTGVGIWASQRIADAEGVDDPQHVVIDEVLGTLIAMGLVRSRSLAVQVLAFAAFRALDITKPWPIGPAEHAEPAGLGIVLDDLLAGLFAGLLARRL
jgi:phosphatidylglycerophosphatase A